MFIAGVRGACAREIAYLRTHPWDLALISWFPPLVMALAWAIFAQGVNVKLPLALVDEDHSPGSRRLAVALEATRSTNIAARPTTLEEAWPLVRARHVYAVVHVPADWERRSQRGDPLPVILYTNEQYHAAGSSLSNDVVGAIEPSVRKTEIERVKRQRPNSFDSYDLLLRSQQFVFAGMPKEAAKAIPLLEEALKLEPDYSAAHAYLAWCFHSRYGRGGLREEDRLAAVQHARAAIAFGSDDATALAIAALVLAYDGHETNTALKVFDRALELSNCNIFVLCWNAAILAWTGRVELAIERAELALRLGPFDPMRWRANYALAVAYFHSQRYADAAEAARTVIDVNPVYSLPRAFLVAALVKLGRVEEAKAMATTVLECHPSFTIHGTALYAELEPAVFRPMADAWCEAGLPVC